MEQTLGIYNIKTVQFFDTKNVARKYAFSSKMLANNIFIEYYTIDPTEEEDLEVSDDEEIEDDVEDTEYGSHLSVIMEHKSKYYQFLLFHSVFEIGVPVMLLQTVIFLTNLIEKIEPAQLIEHFTSIATDPLIPHEIADKEFRDVATKMLKLKIQTVHDLIRADQAGLN